MVWFNKDKEKPLVITENDMKEQTMVGTVLNAIASTLRRGNTSYGISPDGKRDYNQLFGYGVELDFTDYYQLFKRGGIAKSVVQKLPKSCWRDIPKIKAGDKEILESELKSLKRAGLFNGLERADILNRIGNFSVLVVGTPDGEELDKPLGSAKNGDFSSMYFNPYNYYGTEILDTDNDPASPRFGLPTLYQVQTTNIDKSNKKTTQIISRKVHWSRVVHMAEGALDSSIEGSSSLEACWNALVDKDKVRGASAEAFFRNSRQKLALEADKDAKITEGDTSLKENVEQFQNGWEDVLRLKNMKANMLQPSLVSPRDTFDVCVEEISGETGIPIRVLTGKGGGQTNGTEDKASWNALVLDRQEQECTNWLMRSLAIMNEAGLLELPDDAYIEWEPQSALTEVDKAEVSERKAKAFKDATDALSTVGADETDAASVYKEIGLDGIELNSIDFGDEETSDDIKDADE